MLKKIGRWNILIIAIILGLIVSLVRFLIVSPSKEYASAGFMLLYSGAEEGRAPNGQPYSVDVIRGEDFLEGVIEKAGLKDRLSTQELAENMAVRGSYPRDIIQQIKSWDSLLTSDPTRVVRLNDYYPTNFSVSIYNEFKNKLSKAQLTGLLNTLIEEYKLHYQKIYGAGVDWSSIDSVFSPDDRDYMQAVDLLTTKAKMVDEHSQALYEEKQAFAYEGTTFAALSTRAQAIISSDLQSLSANITLNALSRDADALRQKYVHEVETLTIKQLALARNLEKVEALIAGYEMDATIYLGSGDNIITVAGNSKETYEALVQSKSELSAEITETQISIRDLNSKIEDLDAQTEGGSYNEAAITASIKAAEKKINDLIADFDELAKAYNEEYASTSTIRSTSAVFRGNSIASTSFIKTVIMSEAPLCALALIVIFLTGLIAEIKKSGRKSKKIRAAAGTEEA
ncbi:MAG: hypothetical protein IJM80_01255 [Firmicutes bacterium]|nr:hypothetical protein [Bacillota bacterium]